MGNPRSSECDSRMWKAAAAVTFLAFATGCHCKSIYNVGVAVGTGNDTLWDFPPYSSFYQDWADGLEFSVNDTLYFTYDSTSHRVVLVQTQGELDDCRITYPTIDYSDSGALEVSLQPSILIKAYFFMSLFGNGLDCESGMKFNLSVDRPSKPKRGVKLGSSGVLPIDSSKSSLLAAGPATPETPGNGGQTPSPSSPTTPTTVTNGPPSTGTGSKGTNVTVIVAVVVTLSLLFVFAIVGFFICRRYRKQTSFRQYTKQSRKGGETGVENEFETTKASAKKFPEEQNRMKSKLFTLEELKIATSNFLEDKKLGEGGFGTVYKGILKDGQEVAVKRAKAERATDVDQFENEVSILSQLNHCNLVKLLGCCEGQKVPILVFEFISNGTLQDHLRNFRQGHSTELDWQCRFNIALQTAEALKYLHSQAQPPIIHRDVKAANILLDDDFGAKVADFGISKLVDVTGFTHVSTAIRGTPGYLDPEYSSNGQLTDKSDVYSYGIVLLELITSQKPIDDQATNLARRSVPLIKMKRARDIIDARLVKEFSENDFEKVERVAEVAVACLGQERASRPTMSQVVEMLQRIEGSKLKADAFFRRNDITNIDRWEPNFSAILRPFDSIEQSTSNVRGIQEWDI